MAHSALFVLSSQMLVQVAIVKEQTMLNVVVNFLVCLHHQPAISVALLGMIPLMMWCVWCVAFL